jgi:hypothetical protein
MSDLTALTAVFRRYGAVSGACVSPSGRFSTRAGSKVLADAPRAATDAPVVHRIRAAGAVIVPRPTSRSLPSGPPGAKPHYGTPGNPADRSRKPGGSSSGAAVAVAEAPAVGHFNPDPRTHCNRSRTIFIVLSFGSSAI